MREIARRRLEHGGAQRLPPTSEPRLGRWVCAAWAQLQYDELGIFVEYGHYELWCGADHTRGPLAVFTDREAALTAMELL